MRVRVAAAPDEGPERVRLEAALESLRDADVDAAIEVAADGNEPRTYVDDALLVSGRYPTNDELKAATGVTWIAAPEQFFACACSGDWTDGYDGD